MIALLRRLISTRLRLPLLLAVLGAGAVMFGWSLGSPAVIGAARPRNESVTVADWKPYQPSADLRSVQALLPWGADKLLGGKGGDGKDGEGDGEGAGNHPWRLSGIIDRNGTRQALIEIGAVGGAPARFSTLHNGDKLPDGKLIAAVEADGIVVHDSQGGEHRLDLFDPGNRLAPAAAPPPTRGVRAVAKPATPPKPSSAHTNGAAGRR